MPSIHHLETFSIFPRSKRCLNHASHTVTPDLGAMAAHPHSSHHRVQVPASRRATSTARHRAGAILNYFDERRHRAARYLHQHLRCGFSPKRARVGGLAQHQGLSTPPSPTPSSSPLCGRGTHVARSDNIGSEKNHPPGPRDERERGEPPSCKHSGRDLRGLPVVRWRPGHPPRFAGPAACNRFGMAPGLFGFVSSDVCWLLSVPSTLLPARSKQTLLVIRSSATIPRSTFIFSR